MRLHCMEVFHYLANELRDTPIFENEYESTDCTVGSIYNDFDSTPLSLLEDESDPFHYAQVSNDSFSQGTSSQVDEVLQEAVDDAIFEADESSGFLYEHLVRDYTAIYIYIISFYA